jgi:predicted esterase
MASMNGVARSVIGRALLMAAAALVVTAADGSPLSGQERNQAEASDVDWSRYELGRRMRSFERGFIAADVEARKRALVELEPAVRSFFTNDVQAAGRAIDAARRALEGSEAIADAARAWADGLALVPERRCIEPGDARLTLQLVQFHAHDGAPLPEGDLRLHLELAQQDGTVRGTLDSPIAEVPASLQLELPGLEEGDCTLSASIELDGRALSRIAGAISAVRDARKRLESVFEIAMKSREMSNSLEAVTLRGRYGLLRPLLDGGCDETDLPIARMTAEAEQIAAALERGESWLDATRAGQHWLRLPLESAIQPVRLLIPSDATKDSKRPLVIALHGAGGSENLFFDGYGNGLAVELAEQRGWFFIAPRGQLLGPPDVPGLVDCLAERLPIDRERIALLGHSLGADQALQLIGNGMQPRAAVLLSGGWLARPTTEMKSIPFWLGAGSNDFALEPTRALAEALRSAGAERVELHVLECTEHMSVVPIALPEVYAFLDQLLAPR